MGEWKKCNLGSFINIKHGFAFKGKDITRDPTSKILVTPGNFHIGGGFKTDKFKYFNGDHPEEYDLNSGDIIITMTDLSQNGDTLGYSAKVPEVKGKIFLHNQRIGLVELLDNDIEPEFIYWLMRNKEYHYYILGAATGTSIRHTSPKIIKKFCFMLPPLPEQKAIAEVLSSLDDKIDLLHRQNKTLETLAETLFRQWFVEEASEDWEEKSLLDVIDLTGGGTPKTNIPEFWGGVIPWLSGGDIAIGHKAFVMRSEKNITNLGLEKSSAKLLPKLATVISARGTVGKFAMLSRPMAYSQSNYGVFPKIKDCFFFTYLLINHVVDELQSSAYGSVFDTITTSTFKDVSVKIPKEPEVQSFEKKIANYYGKKLSNLEQVRTLEQLRDTLLLKLMNGEIRLKIKRSIIDGVSSYR